VNEEITKSLRLAVYAPLQDLDADPVAQVLGLMNFQTCPIAHLFAATGEEIPHKVEREQSFILRWLVKLALEHGDAWREAADVEIKRRQALLRAKTDA
jgi:hypothetical protein